MDSRQIQHDESRQRFEAGPAHLSYRRENGRMIIEHTYVPPPLRGRGIAGALAQAALDEARRRDWKVVPQCSYLAAYIARHGEFADLVEQAPPLTTL